MSEQTPAQTTEDPVNQRNAKVAEAYSFLETVEEAISKQEHEKASYLAGMALEIVTKACGDTAFECWKFYYTLADAQLGKLETSNDPLNVGGTDKALTMDAIEKSMDKIPEVLAESAGKVKEMFEQLAKKQKGENMPAPKENSKPAEAPKDTPKVEAPAPVEKKPVEEKKESKWDKDNPLVNDEDEEEEIITTTKEPERKPVEPAKPKPSPEFPEEDDYSDQFRAPWENLEVALHIFNTTRNSQDDPVEFEQQNWNLKADILERQADLEAARENIPEAIKLYNLLIDLWVKHNCDRQKSRTIAWILYKIGCSYQIIPESVQAGLDTFHEAVSILIGIFIEEIKSKDPEEAEKLTVHSLKNNENLKKVEIQSDKAKDLQGIIMDINNKIEECSQSLKDKPILDKMKKNAEQGNTFKKPIFTNKEAVNLGSFGKGKKRTATEAKEAKENGTDKKEDSSTQEDDPKRQKTEE